MKMSADQLRKFVRRVSWFGDVAMRRLLCYFLVLLSTSVAGGGLFRPDVDPDAKPWTESEMAFPAFPVPANMIPFSVDWRSDMKFMVDGQSISVGNDGVIRFTLEVVSPEGVRNISYEGMRCETAARRPYAFGRTDGTWSKARSERWIPIRGSGNNHYVELFANYFCSRHGPAVMTPEDARRILRQGGVGAT